LLDGSRRVGPLVADRPYGVDHHARGHPQVRHQVTRKAAGELSERLSARLATLREAGIWSPPAEHGAVMAVSHGRDLDVVAQHPFEPELPKCAYDSSTVGTKDCPATQDPICAQVCMPFTPNGCDCFGCCTFDGAGPGGVGTRDVWIGALDSSNNSTCTLATLSDPAKCPTCTPVANCYNPCDMCEVCVGGGLPDPSCEPSMQCPQGYQACGLAGQAECPMGSYCVTGCCQAVIL